MIILRAKDVALPLIKVAHMNSVPILELLHLEEKLLRTSSDNWFIVSEGRINPTIVMGISGKPSELIEIKPVLHDGIPVIKRFTGGGTVIVDHGTIFASIICNKDSVPGLQPYPRPIMSWTEQLYGKVFNGFGDFRLRENDYVFDTRKFGGNAQSIIKNRWIHHTSFLWDFDVENMGYLKLPKRAPEYRSARDHIEFLCRMKEYLPTKSTFSEKAIASLENHFRVENISPELSFDSFSSTSYTPSTKLLTEQELIEAHSGLMK